MKLSLRADKLFRNSSIGVKKFWSSKKFWLIFALIGTGLFICFLWFSPEIIPGEVKSSPEIRETVNKSVSSVYRYDFQKQEYLFDEGQSWQNSDFTRFIYDLAPEGSKLDRCYYFLYDNLRKEMSGGSRRKCNSNLTITVGENKNCSSQGENACTLYVYAVDDLGIQGEMETVTYNIDWGKPQIGKVYKKDDAFQAEVSDNVKVGYCWLYLDEKNIGSMIINGSLAVLFYSSGEKESYGVFAKCADHYDAEKKEYLNLAVGESVVIGAPVNHPPQISFCKVSPTQGNIQTDFQFSVAVSDSDGDDLSYNWEFGDGEKFSEKNSMHRYKSVGTYESKITVSDKKGEKDECSTAWVVVGE